MAIEETCLPLGIAGRGTLLAPSGADRLPGFTVDARVAAVLEGRQAATVDLAPRDGLYDCIVSLDALDRTKDPATMFSHLRQHLAPDGRVIARVGNVRHHRRLSNLLAGHWAGDEDRARGRLRFYTRREIEKLLYRQGFQVEHIQPVANADLDAWRQRGSPAEIHVDGLQSCGLPAEQIEELYAEQFWVVFSPRTRSDFGLTSIVIVTFNQLPFTQQCLESIRFRTDEPYEVIVVDNGSTDGTVEYLQSLGDVVVIANHENRGFPTAANQGIRAARGEQVLLLNNDVIVTTGWLDRLLNSLYREPAIGLVGPCSNYTSGHQQVPVSYDDLACLDGFAWSWAKMHDLEQHDVDRLVGFCLLIRREVIRKIGLLDERFGVGNYEDDDYCRRAIAAGYKAVVARDAFIHHFGHVSFDGNGIDLNALLLKNRQLYEEKWQSRSQPIAQSLSTISTSLAHLSARFPWPEQPPDVPMPEKHAGWFEASAQQALSEVLTDQTRLIVELGAWLGLSTRFLLDRAPQASVVTIDHWKGSPEHHDHPEWRKLLPRLYETFLAANWEYRHRLIPVRMTTIEGLQQIGSLGITPDLIYVDADHAHAAVIADLEECRRLFPRTLLVGDDYGNRSVRGAVDEFAARHSLRVEVVGQEWPAWRLRLSLQQDRPASDSDSGQSLKPITLSLCMIVRDNATTIRPALESIRPFVDEMIVVDTGSKDETPEIARQLGARVFAVPWPDCFSTARNESLKHARGEWIFWMDSDDSIDPENGRGLRELIATLHDSRIAGCVMQVHCPARHRDGHQEVTAVDHVKLFRNRPEFRFEGRIHEQIIPALRRSGGEILRTSLFVTHSGSDQTPEGRLRKLKRDLRLLHLDRRDRPDHPFVLFNLGMTYHDAGKHAKAVKALSRCLEVSPAADSHVRKAYSLLVGSLTELERRDAAWQTCLRGLELTPRDPELLFRKAVLAQHDSRWQEAEQCYLSAMANDDDPHFSSIDVGIVGYKARFNLAGVYSSMGRPDKAEQQWRRVVAEVPNYVDGWRGLGEILLKQGRHEELAQVAQQLQEKPNLRGIGLCLAARVSWATRQLQSAREQFEQAIKASPDDTEILQAHCRFLFETCDWPRAEIALQSLVALDPADSSALYNLGLVQLRLRQFTHAVTALQRAAELRPTSAMTFLHFGAAQAECGRHDEAISSWRKAIRLDPNGTAGIVAAQEILRVQTLDKWQHGTRRID